MTNIFIFYSYFVVFLSSIIFISPFTKEIKRYSLPLSFLVIVATIFLLLFRDPLAPADSRNYMLMYGQVIDLGSVFEAYHKNYAFSLTQYLGQLLGLAPEQFLLFQSVFFYFISVLGLWLICNSNKKFLIALSLFSITSTFLLLFTNVIRQGLALSLIFLAAGMYLRGKKAGFFLALIFLFFSHSSGILGSFLLLAATRLRGSQNTVLIFILALPVIPFVSQIFVEMLSSFGGVFGKIQSLGNRDYSNTLVYVKSAIIYGFVFILYYLKVWRSGSDVALRFMANIYLGFVFVVFFFLPVLLVSSRFIYYAGGLMPVLLSLILLNPSLRFERNKVAGLTFLGSLVYGIFVYSFPSTRAQLGG